MGDEGMKYTEQNLKDSLFNLHKGEMTKEFYEELIGQINITNEQQSIEYFYVKESNLLIEYIFVCEKITFCICLETDSEGIVDTFYWGTSFSNFWLKEYLEETSDERKNNGI